MRAAGRDEPRSARERSVEPREAPPAPARAALTAGLLSALGNRRVAALVAARRGPATLGRAAHATLARKADFDLEEWQLSLDEREDLQGHQDLAPIWDLLKDWTPNEGFEIGAPEDGGHDRSDDDETKAPDPDAPIRAAIEKLLDDLLAADDVEEITAVVQAGLAGQNVTAEEVKLVKTYDFDSGLVSFTAENYVAWTRLANGQATIDDLRFFLHELVEMRDARQTFDITGAQGDEGFDPVYEASHNVALMQEMNFLVAQVSSRVPGTTWQQIAVSDEERWVEFLPALHAREGDGTPINPLNPDATRAKYAHYRKPAVGQALTQMKAQAAPKPAVLVL